MDKTLLLCVAAVGSIGAIGKYCLSIWACNALDTGFPLGTLSVNSIGSFLLGFVSSLALEGSSVAPHFRALAMIGFWVRLLRSQPSASKRLTSSVKATRPQQCITL